MKWITRANVKVDRVACPWLIRTFIDRDAEFLFVPAGDFEMNPPFFQFDAFAHPERMRHEACEGHKIEIAMQIQFGERQARRLGRISQGRCRFVHQDK